MVQNRCGSVEGGLNMLFISLNVKLMMLTVYLCLQWFGFTLMRLSLTCNECCHLLVFLDNFRSLGYRFRELEIFKVVLFFTNVI